MALDLGDYAIETDESTVVSVSSDGTGSAGDIVAISSGSVTQIGGTGSTIFGVLAEDPGGTGSEVAVVKYGDVMVNASTDVSAGDVVESSSGGQVQSNSNGKEVTGGSFSNTFAPANPEALVGAGGSFSTAASGQSLGSNCAIVYLK